MYIALSCMFAGIFIGRLLRDKMRLGLSPYILVVICLLLFVLGVELGLNDRLVSKFTHIGLTAFIIAFMAVSGSCAAAKLFSVFIPGNKKTEMKKEDVTNP